MITSIEIKFGMIEMDYRTLKHEINQYIKIGIVQVQDIISNGVEGKYEKYVAFVLGLKKYFPEGWKPLLRVIAVKVRRSLPKQYTFGNMGFQGRRGQAHYKNQGRYWKKDDVARLLELRADQKLSLSDIADAMGKTYDAVQSKLSYMRIDGTL